MSGYHPEVLPVASSDPIVAPTVNINGTSRLSLLGDYLDAMASIRATLTSLAKITPHGRDYQTVPHEAYTVAREQHFARVAAIEKVYDEITSIAMAVHDQGG